MILCHQHLLLLMYLRAQCREQKESGTRRHEFEEREAITKLDPLHWHKYTRRMISEGFEPKETELDSITPQCDLLKGLIQTELALRREPYGLCQKPKHEKAILHAPLTKEVVGSGCHTTFTCNVTQIGTKGVMTQSPCGDVGCERLASVTTRLAKRTGDTRT